jgi:hypothetical protein
MHPSAGHHSATFQRRGVSKVAMTQSSLARRRRETRPGKSLLALRRRWHEGTADTTLLTSLRGWMSALLPGHSHNTHCPFGRAKTSHLNSFRADNSPRAGPFGAELRSDNVALCAVPPLHCHADCFPDSPSGTPPPVAWQSSRQLAGIPHANAAAPRAFLS